MFSHDGGLNTFTEEQLTASRLDFYEGQGQHLQGLPTDLVSLTTVYITALWNLRLGSDHEIRQLQ